MPFKMILYLRKRKVKFFWLIEHLRSNKWGKTWSLIFLYWSCQLRNTVFNSFDLLRQGCISAWITCSTCDLNTLHRVTFPALHKNAYQKINYLIFILKNANINQNNKVKKGRKMWKYRKRKKKEDRHE